MELRIQEELQRLYEYPESFDGILTDVKRNLLKDFELDKQKNSFWTSWIRNSIFNQHPLASRQIQSSFVIRKKDINPHSKLRLHYRLFPFPHANG